MVRQTGRGYWQNRHHAQDQSTVHKVHETHAMPSTQRKNTVVLISQVIFCYGTKIKFCQIFYYSRGVWSSGFTKCMTRHLSLSPPQSYSPTRRDATQGMKSVVEASFNVQTWTRPSSLATYPPSTVIHKFLKGFLDPKTGPQSIRTLFLFWLLRLLLLSDFHSTKTFPFRIATDRNQTLRKPTLHRVRFLI